MVALRWCVSRGILDVLRSKQVLNPLLFISVIGQEDKNEVERRLFPLSDAMIYIHLRKPGSFVINAFIVWSKENTKGGDQALTNQLLGLNRWGNFEFHLRNHAGEIRQDRLEEACGYQTEAKIDIQVPEEFFAPEPKDWEKWWVNLWHDTAPIDQCAFRKRRMLAYSLQPPIELGRVILLPIIRLVYGLGLLLIGQRINFWTIFHPYENKTKDVKWEDEEFAQFVTWSKEGDQHPGYFILCHPLVILPLLTFVITITRLGWWGETLKAGSYILPIFLVICLFAWWACKKYFEKEAIALRQEQRVARQKEVEKNYRQERLRRVYDNDLSAVTCTGTPLKATVADLPATKRTIRLRFLDIKSKVCKPFAG